MAERSFTYETVDNNGNPITVTTTLSELQKKIVIQEETLKQDAEYSRMLVTHMAPHYARIEGEYAKTVQKRNADYESGNRIIVALIIAIATIALATAVFSPSHKSSASYIARHGY